MPRSTAPNDDAICFGLSVRRLRVQRGWTLLDLSRYTGMNPKYLSVMETGGNAPSISSLFRIATAFGVDPADFIREIQDFRAKFTPPPRKGTN